MLKKVLYVIVSAVILLAGVGLLLPREVHVERSIDIDRPAVTVFTLVNGFSTFNSWSPWAERDPSAAYERSGPDQGVGARLAWSGDPRLSGSGTQQIVASEPYQRVRMQLDFDQQGEASSYFEINERPGGVSLTWGFDTDLTAGQGPLSGLVARYFGLLFDRWIGSDYEAGLRNLKSLAESLPNVDFSDLDVEVLTVEPVNILFIENTSSQGAGEIAAALAGAYREISAFMQQNGIGMSSQPMAITRAWDENGYAFDAAIPFVGPAPVPGAESQVRVGVTPSGRAVRVVHRGPYDEMLTSYEKLAVYMATHGLKEGSASWEHYISDPGQTSERDLITHIYFLLAP